MTYINYTRRKKTHRGLIIKMALFVIAAIMISWTLGNGLFNIADAVTIMEPAASEMPTQLSSKATREEPAKYNLASIQGTSAFDIIAGEEINTHIGFYNVDGNRDTHITMTIDQAPEGWTIEIDPTLTIEVQELLQEPAEQLQEGTMNVTLGDRGYAVAKTCRISITAPDNVEQGTTAEIIITAKAEWYGQTGQVVICQTRSFDYSIEVTG